MIRKIYLEFLREKWARGELGWLLSRGLQYGLIHASALLGRPLCGPILGTLITNYRCNYDCVMCDLKLRDRELRARGLEEFDTERMKGILRDFAALGISGVGFTGGEPLLRKDIFELLAFTKALGMISHLNTNASLLDEQRMRDVLDARVDSLNVSLDGARADTHDAIRGVPGAFQHARDAIRKLQEMRKKRGSLLPRLKTVTVLQEKNVDEVREIVELAADLGVDCVEFIPCQPFRSDRLPGLDREEIVLGKMEQAVRYLQGRSGVVPVKVENSSMHLRGAARWFREGRSPLRCYASYNSTTVDCFGEIYPCLPWANWRRSVGNVRDADLRKFWRSRGMNECRKQISSCRECYLNCQAELNILFQMPHVRRKT